jgi:hypothetical protein
MRGVHLMKKPIGLAACLWGAAVLAASQNPTRPPAQPSARPLVDYQRQVHPVLDAACSECHSQDKRKGGLSLATYADVLEGPQRRGPPSNSAVNLLASRRRHRAADAKGRDR